LWERRKEKASRNGREEVNEGKEIKRKGNYGDKEDGKNCRKGKVRKGETEREKWSEEDRESRRRRRERKEKFEKGREKR
jgi:hypothetical protein